MGPAYEAQKIGAAFYCSQNCLLPQPPWPQQGAPRPQLAPASEQWLTFPLEITPAPPLISLFTEPPHDGQNSTAGSVIF
jgi:hypothetical protein